MKLKIYQIDAFAGALFRGNPAAVCPLEKWLPDSLLQNIAAENNLSETAFYVRRGDVHELRWFSPLKEVELCGHATLAAAHVTLEQDGQQTVNFETSSGPLRVERNGDLLRMDFPALPAIPCAAPERLIAALGVKIEECYSNMDYLVVVGSEEEVAAARPDMRALCDVDLRGVILTGPGKEADFVSRFFAPKYGIDEDPVTGSAHCMLAPYWAKRLGRQLLKARQISQRGGEIDCETRGERVFISGHTVKYMSGTIYLPD